MLLLLLPLMWLQLTLKHDMDEKMAFFRSLQCFKEWNRRKLTTMSYAAKKVTFTTRSHLFQAGDPVDGVYFIHSGYCKVRDARGHQYRDQSLDTPSFPPPVLALYD